MSVKTKLLSVMLQVPYLAADRQMPKEAGGYMYLSEDRLTGELHPRFAELGLIIYPTGMSIISESDDGKTQTRYVRVEAHYRIVDTEDDSYIDIVALGEGSDKRDKALSKALTSAYKAALLQTLMISNGPASDAERPGSHGKKSSKEPVVCSTPGCGAVLTPGQLAYSEKAFGKPLCMHCQNVEKSKETAKEK
ncbi:MAG: ERF family protein [Armatimonadota bacterium]